MNFVFGRSFRSIRWALIALLSLASVLQAQSGGGESDVRIVLTGDSLVNQRLSTSTDPAGVALFRIIQQSDAAFTNFETLIHSYAFPAAAESGGAYASAPTWLPSELKWAGFNLLSTANNHSYDFGERGLLSTLKALDDAGFAHAGTGINLAFARAPGYVETPKGRFSLVAVTSTFSSASIAGEQRPDLIGRPGVNPLRFTTTYTVNQELFDALLKVSALAEHGGAGEERRGRSARSSVRIGGLQFCVGDGQGVHTQLNKNDLEGLIASVRNARRESEWVIVSSHTHESGDRQENPPEFLIQAAHAAIDAGADVFVAHGPHILRGIEIYKNKPIFYSLGNFIFENETMLFQPAESYNDLGLPANSTTADYYDARSANDTRGFPANKSVWESSIAEVSFHTDHTLNKVVLTPISLGYKEPRSRRGRPRLAGPEQSKQTIEHLAKLSAQYGTTISEQNGRGMITGEEKTR
jgi:poly-gamma-glutamate synthesis protein (capsule biosynthesis protein)